MNIDIITMGCSKNLVDSEHLISLFSEYGFKLFHNPQYTHGDYAVINTCGFIASAKEESINMILKLCALKEQGKLKKVFVMGCLSERYMTELQDEIPEVDKFYGKFNWKELIADLAQETSLTQRHKRCITTPKHYAYIKIAEGCDRKCAYCAIPLMTGKHKSRKIEEIVEEIKGLVDKGVKEFQIIEQELTYYGIDLYHRSSIATLIEKIANIPGVEWIRLHYAYPNNFPLELLDVINKYDNVCKYIDIALQHISDPILQRMRRNVSQNETKELITLIRKKVPNICLRTTLLVGFPGETENDMEELEAFVKEYKFDRLGVFAYSEEEGTFAAEHYDDDTPQDIKDDRVDRIMRIQQQISKELNEKKIGKVFKTIIDKYEGGYYIGRTEYDSPEVDPEVLISSESPLKIGEFYPVLITDANDYDLYGKIDIQ